MQITKIGVTKQDERGDIIDVLVKQPVEYATIITSRKGAVRGNHFHKDTFQYLYVLSGRLKAFSQMPDGPVKSAELGVGDLILNVPGERHSFEALEDSSFLVLTRGPRGGDDYENDTYRLTEPLKD